MSEQYMAFAGAIFLLMVSPGPMVTQVMLDARRGWPWATVLGGVLSAQCLLALALWMLHWAWQVQPQLLLGVQIVGGGYLLWLGWRSWPAWSADAEPAPASSARGFWRAMALGLSNPKDIVFFLAFLPGFLQADAPFAWQAFWLMAIWGVIDASVLSAYGVLAHRLQHWPLMRGLLRWGPPLALLSLGALALLGGLRDGLSA